MARFTCECCGKDFSEALLEVHHLSPKEYGVPPGMDSVDDPRNLTCIDEHCHSLVHRSAGFMAKGKDPTPMLLSVYEDESGQDQQRIIAETLRMAGIITEAMKRREESGEAHRPRSKLMADIDFDFYNLEVKAAAAACKTSIARFIEQAVIEKTRQVNGPVFGVKSTTASPRPMPRVNRK